MRTRKVPPCSICGEPAAALLFDFPVCEKCHTAITSDADICFECHAVLGEGEEIFCSECDPGDPPPIDWEAELAAEADPDEGETSF